MMRSVIRTKYTDKQRDTCKKHQVSTMQVCVCVCMYVCVCLCVFALKQYAR